ncbi:PQQ-binding-like beta-propeller repeat protein [Chloroflexota bacterium]
MTQQSRVLGAALLLLLLIIVLAGCGGAPVAQNWPGLTIDGDTVYVISGAPQQVYMLDAETGTQKGTFIPEGEPPKGAVYWSPVEVGDGLAFVGFAEPQNSTAAMYAFDPATGEELWDIPAELFVIPAPTYAGDVVYFGDTAGNVYAVDIESKSIKPGWPFVAESAIWASPLVVGDTLYVAAMDHHVYALDRETGEVTWKQEVGGAMAAQPTLDEDNGILYVGAFDGGVYALDAASGEPVQGFNFVSDGWVWSEVLVQDGRLYVTSLDGKMYALDPTTGDPLDGLTYDSAQAGDKDDRLRASPVESGESVIVAAESGRVVSTKDAVQQWAWPSGVPQQSVLTTPVVLDGTVFVVLEDGSVQTLDAESGTQGWTFSPPEAD